MSSAIKKFVLPSLVLVLFLYGLAAKDFYTRGEAREAVVVQSIFNDHKWILPEGYGGAIPSKPPVMHWLAAATEYVFPQNPELAIRLPTFVLAALLCGLFFYLVQKRTDSARAAVATLILASSPEWFRAALAARVDMTLAVALCFAVYFGFRVLEKVSLLTIYATGIFLGVAILAKGPVAVVLWGAPLGLLVLFRRRATFWSDFFKLLASLVIALLIGASWYYAAYLVHPKEFIEKIYYENVARFLSQQDDEPHKASFLSLWLLFWVGVLPWGFVLITRAKTIWSSKSSWLSRLKSIPQFEFVLALQIFVTLIFFSIPEGKRSVYLLPAYPAVAYFLSASIRPFGEKTVSIAKIVMSALCLLWIALIVFANTFNSCGAGYCFTLHTYARGIKDSSPILLALGILIPIVTLIGAKKYKAKRSQVICLYVGILTVLSTCWFTIFANAVSPRDFLATLDKQQLASQQLFSFGNEFYAVSFYLNRPMVRVEQYSERSARPVHGIVFFYHDDQERLRKIIPELTPIATSDYGIIRDDKPLIAAKF